MKTHQHTPGKTLTVTTSVLAVAALAINSWPAMGVARGANAEGSATITAMGTATARVSGTTLYFTGGSAESDLSVSLTNPAYVTDLSGLTAGPGCTQVDPTQVDCPGYNDLVVDLGEGNDRAALGALIYTHRIRLDAGTGDDTVYSGDGDDSIAGGPGNDYLTGGAGRDKLDGQEGDDTLRGNSSDDTITGGPGMDSVDGDGGSPLDDGNDRLYLADGEKDVAQCGFGADTVEADSIDVVEEVSCESITRTTPPPTTPPPTTPTVPTQVTGAKAVVKKGKAKITWKASTGATSYKVRYSKPGGKKYRAWKSITALKFTFKVSKGKKYAVQIIPVGDGGAGPTKTLRFKAK
jgi:hypothetical protein